MDSLPSSSQRKSTGKPEQDLSLDLFSREVRTEASGLLSQQLAQTESERNALKDALQQASESEVTLREELEATQATLSTVLAEMAALKLQTHTAEELLMTERAAAAKAEHQRALVRDGIHLARGDGVAEDEALPRRVPLAPMVGPRCVVNVVGMLAFNVGFTEWEPIAALDENVFSHHGQIMVLVWGLAYLAAGSLPWQGEDADAVASAKRELLVEGVGAVAALTDGVECPAAAAALRALHAEVVRASREHGAVDYATCLAALEAEQEASGLR